MASCRFLYHSHEKEFTKIYIFNNDFLKYLSKVKPDKSNEIQLTDAIELYINDGTYGTLFDAGTPNIVFPTKMIKDNSNKIVSKKLTAFDFYGPTCDSMDYMKGPFLLPNNIKENDYIELGQLGAYGLTFRTQFNGYYSNEIYEVEDKPIMTMYDKDINKANMVA